MLRKSCSRSPAPARRREVVVDGGDCWAGEVLPRPLVIVPSAERGHHAPFILRVFCTSAFELWQAPAVEVVSCSGVWGAASSGGPPKAPRWHMNPQLWLTLQPPSTGAVLTTVQLTLDISPPDADAADDTAAAALLSSTSAAGAPHARWLHNPSRRAPQGQTQLLRRGQTNTDRSPPRSPPRSRPGSAGPGRGGAAAARLRRPRRARRARRRRPALATAVRAAHAAVPHASRTTGRR